MFDALSRLATTLVLSALPLAAEAQTVSRECAAMLSVLLPAASFTCAP